MTENYLLEVKNVSKSFGVVKALNRIDFNVRPNEIHALCGENGAGKSTLMNILSGVYPYGSYGGEVYYDGELCKFRNVRESEKKNIAIIHQHLALFPALSIAENNLYDCGRLQGEYIVKALDLDNTTESFNLELFSGDPADSNAPYFFNGAYDALSPYIESGKLNVLSGQIERDVTATADWDGLKAQERMDTILSTYYKGDTRIDAVMCNNDAIALGVLASLKNVGYGTAEKPFPVITGMDCDIANIKAIKSGEISMTVFKDNRIIAKKAAEVMDCVLHDKTPQAGDAFETTFNNGVCDVTAFLIAPEVIDKDNYQAALFDSGYYSEDQLK